MKRVQSIALSDQLIEEWYRTKKLEIKDVTEFLD